MPNPFTFATPSGLTLRGEVWGEGTRDLVFTHGNGFTVQSYGPTLAPLAPRVRIHGLNLRGHGGSEVPEDFPNWDGPFEDLTAYVRERCSTPALIAGHSYGATLSLRLAAQHPELVGGLLLMEPLVLWGRNDNWAERDAARSGAMVAAARDRRGEWPTREEAAAWLRARGSYRAWAEPAFAAFAATAIVPSPSGGVRLACPPWLEARGYATLPDAVVFRWADKIRAPAVFLRGRDSFPGGPMEELARAIPIAVVMALKGTHAFPMEHPAETGKALASGLDILLRSEGGGNAKL